MTSGAEEVGAARRVMTEMIVLQSVELSRRIFNSRRGWCRFRQYRRPRPPDNTHYG